MFYIFLITLIPILYFFLRAIITIIIIPFINNYILPLIVYKKVLLILYIIYSNTSRDSSRELGIY